MNQKNVVKNEIRMNVLNQPYGGFPWLDMPQCANANWHNAHNFYGEFDQLEASTVDEVREFFRTYYRPDNAVLVVIGDIDTAAARTMVRTYFGDISPGRPVPTPDVSEPRQEGPKRFRKGDPLANRPALAFGYHMPERNSLEYYAMGLLDQILLQGDDAMLNDVLVRKKGLTGGIGGGINVELGNMFDCNGPMLWIASLYHDNDVLPDSIIAAVDSVIESLCVVKLDDAAVGRARIKFRSQFYDMNGAFFGMGRANLLGAFALFDDDPGMINEIEKHMRDITPAVLQRTAAQYLRKTNQTVLIIVPAPAKSQWAKQ
jgi:zinc protease